MIPPSPDRQVIDAAQLVAHHPVRVAIATEGKLAHHLEPEAVASCSHNSESELGIYHGKERL